jgi:hypothetical protein
MEIYRIRVLDGRPIAGYSQTGERLQIMPGDYDVTWISIARDKGPSPHGVLRVKDADNRGGDLDVICDEFLDDLGGFPELGSESKFQLITA